MVILMRLPVISENTLVNELDFLAGLDLGFFHFSQISTLRYLNPGGNRIPFGCMPFNTLTTLMLRIWLSTDTCMPPVE